MANYDNSHVLRVLASLTVEQKQRLETLGVTKALRSNWKHGHRKPTAAQLKTLAVIAGADVEPMLDHLAVQEATPAQLDLFRRALATAAGLVLTVILSAVPMSKSACAATTSPEFDTNGDSAHYTRFMRLLRRLKTLVHSFTKAPTGAFFFDLIGR